MTAEPAWLDIDAVRIFHDETIGRDGGVTGLRDAALLDSALNRPRNAWTYGEHDLFALAALYSHGVMKNHPFADGNKRSGFLSGAVFLAINGQRLDATNEEVVENAYALAAGAIDAEAYAAFLRASSKPT